MSRLPLVALVGLQSHRDLKVGALLSAFETVVVDSPEAAAAPSTGCLAVVLAPSARLQGAALLDAVARSPIPVLLLCDPVTLDAALDDLGPHADVCLLSAPPRLIERRLKQLLSRTSAMTDALTGAMARGRFLSLVEDRLDAATAATPVSLVVFDLDHFKKRNDDLGHQAGDQLLRQFVQRAKSALGPEDYFARLGGEEFGVCTNADEDTAFELAERVRIACGQTPFDVDTAPVGPQVTVSAGVATASAPCATGEILQAVDEALYAAKAGGRNLCVRSSTLNDHGERSEAAFEHLTQVLSERVANVIARRGRRLFRELRQEADEDALTGLLGRRYLDRRLPSDVERAHADRNAFAFALLDVDHFGAVNKTHGWPTGDRVLREVARTARALVDPLGWVARYGGEEFALVFPASTLKEAQATLDALVRTVRNSTISLRDAAGRPSGVDVHVTVSIGATELRPGESEDALLERASSLLLAAKTAGRDTIQFDAAADAR